MHTVSSESVCNTNQKLIPEYASNINEHNPVDWEGLHQALQEHKEELARFTEGESDPEMSDKEGEEEGEYQEVIEVIPLIPGSLSSKSTQ